MAYEPRIFLPGTENNLLHKNVNLFHGTLHTGSEQIKTYQQESLGFFSSPKF